MAQTNAIRGNNVKEYRHSFQYKNLKEEMRQAN